MEISLLIPDQRVISLEDALLLLTEQDTELTAPFSEEVMEFCGTLSQAIFRDKDAARFPELFALAFWMRKAELMRLRSAFQAVVPPETIALPRGLVFHVPPGNVDTIFVYSWLLSALAGNRNVIRMSSRGTPQGAILLRLWRETLQSAPRLRSNTVVLSYGHDRDVTAALSMLCDVRVIWGGDHTVSEIRGIALPPHAREITFPDRYSLAVLSAPRYLELSAVEADRLAANFFNDVYWFDQMACSSPETVIWCGDVETSREAADRFWTALAACNARKEYQSAPAIQMRKLLFACESIIDLPAVEYRKERDASIVTLESLDCLPRERCGGGMFLSYRIDDLTQLARILRKKDQTLTYFGFSDTELRKFVLSLRGRSIDRIVPIGQALQFNRFWDGYDLLHEFCTFTFVSATQI
jgi:hypothetical protein